MQKHRPNFNCNHQLNCARLRMVTAAVSLFGALSGTVANAQEEMPLLPGSYRLEMIMASVTRVPFFGTSKSASKSISLVEIKRDGNALIQTHKVCDFRVLEDSKFIKMVFPEKFIAALAQHTYPLQLEKDGQAWNYGADLGVETIGYKPTDKDEKLPSSVDDPAVYDWDGDGHPGATLKISIPLLPDGELYVVQRGHSILSGKVVQPGRVEGSISTRLFEQRVLGAWPGFLNQSPEIQPDPSASRFTLSQVNGGSSCETLRSAGAKP
jgi:hypothetical protein